MYFANDFYELCPFIELFCVFYLGCVGVNVGA